MWNAFEDLLTIHGNFLSIYCILWEKTSSFDLNYFFKENAQIVTYSKHFSILALLNVNEVLQVLSSVGVIFHFNLPDPCAVQWGVVYALYTISLLCSITNVFCFVLFCFPRLHIQSEWWAKISAQGTESQYILPPRTLLDTHKATKRQRMKARAASCLICVWAASWRRRRSWKSSSTAEARTKRSLQRSPRTVWLSQPPAQQRQHPRPTAAPCSQELQKTQQLCLGSTAPSQGDWGSPPGDPSLYTCTAGKTFSSTTIYTRRSCRL